MENKTWPNEKEPCWDCGSTIPNHHTALCDFTEDGNILDLPMISGTQWWDKPSDNQG
jgi:hypothetical protein